MSKDHQITLFYSPQTRATGARVLLEELQVPYDLHVLNMKTGEQRQPAYLAINPLGKVPAVRVGETLVTEQGAIYLYLADLFPESGLAPALTDPDRGAYLRWLFIYGSCFEPAVVDRFMKREPGSMNETPYASYESLIDMLEEALKTGPYLLGERFHGSGPALGDRAALDDDVRPCRGTPRLPGIHGADRQPRQHPEGSADDAAMVAEHEAIAARMKAAS